MMTLEYEQEVRNRGMITATTSLFQQNDGATLTQSGGGIREALVIHNWSNPTLW